MADSTDDIRQAWRDAHVVPLWESPTAHKPPPQAEPAQLWPWSALRPAISGAVQIQSPAAIERRVLSLVRKTARGPEDEATIAGIAAAIQILMPGESARSHRHSMNALRFVLDGSGASTIVDGKDCPMDAGDLVITPGWCWHAHVHRGSAPIVWLDVLDVPFHQYLGTAAFEPGPTHDVPNWIDDGAFAAANMVPDIDEPSANHSPVFRYPWANAIAALSRTPPGKDGSRRLRYINPRTGGAVMSLIDCYLVEIDADVQTLPFRTSASAVCTVVEGSGSSMIGTQSVSWSPKDIFTLPQGNWIRHRAEGGKARMFVVTDREIFRRLDLLREEYGNAASG